MVRLGPLLPTSLRMLRVLRVVLIPLVGAAGACLGGAPPRLRTSPAGGGAIVGGVRLGWETKTVLTKQPPETLVADDGTVCRVAPDRYKDTAPGARIVCEWQLGAPPVDSLEQDGARR